MGVELVTSGAFAAEGANDAVFRCAEGRSVNVSDVNGGVDAGVALRRTDGNAHRAGVGFDVFIAVDAIDLKTASIESNPQR